MGCFFFGALGGWVREGVELADEFVAHVLHVVEELLEHAEQPSVVAHKIINVIFLHA